MHLLVEGVFLEWRDRITSAPAVLVGKPVIKGTRISVELILGWLANGWTYEQLLEAYPHITREDILASLSFSEEMLRDEDYVPRLRFTP
ncbi:MAG: DUF433 domain-containing protein [Burkholderiales bacterium]